MKSKRLRDLRIAKYVLNIGTYAGLGIAGIFTSLPEGSPLLYLRPENLTMNINVIIPIIFTMFGLFAVLSDQIQAYFKLPRGVGVAVILFGMGFIGWLISYWLMVVTGVYLILTIVNTLYFNPQITEELDAIKAIKLEKRKEESKHHV